MATNCEDVSAQMMDLLYGELPADARANVDTHVAGCARCRNELASFEKTRAAARAGLDEAPPARARAAIMKAAAAHLAAQAQPAARKPVVPERVSFWDRIRAHWTLPTLATVGALAVFLVANRVFLNPERTLDSSRAPQGQEAPAAAPPAGAPAIQPVPPPVPSADPAAAAPAKAPRPTATISDNPLDGLGLDGLLDENSARKGSAHSKAGKKVASEAPGGAGYGGPSANAWAGDRSDRVKDSAKTESLLKSGGGERRFAQPPAEKPAPEMANAPRDRQAGEDKFAPPPPPREGSTAKHKEAAKAAVAKPVATKEWSDPFDLVPPSPAPPKRAPPAPSPAKPRAGANDDFVAKNAEAGVGSIGVVGGSPVQRNKADGYGSGGAALAAPAAPPSQRPATAATGERNEMKRSEPPPVVAVAPTPPPPSPVASSSTRAQAKPRAKASADFDAEESYPSQLEGDAKAEKKQVSTKGGAIETLVQRADRLFAEGRWSEAVAAYKELLRRDPHNEEAKRWQGRLAAAENADMSERQDMVAKRKAAPRRPAADSAEAAAQQRGADGKASQAPQAAPRTSKAARSSEKSAVQTGDAAR